MLAAHYHWSAGRPRTAHLVALPATAAAPGWEAGISPRSRAEPILDAWCGLLLGPAANIVINIASSEPLISHPGIVTFGKTRSQGPRGHYYVVYQYEQEEVGVEAGRLALTLLHSLLPPELRPPSLDGSGQAYRHIL